MTTEKELTGYPSIDKPWLKYYSEEAINTPYPECTIYEYIFEKNKSNLTKPAIRYFDKSFTYDQMFSSIEDAAKGFSAIGVKKANSFQCVCLQCQKQFILSML